MMHSTTTDRETVKAYLQCVLCTDRGVITKCYKDSLVYTDPEDTSTDAVLAPIICYCCGDDKGKQHEAEYYREKGVPIDYILSTIIGHDAHMEHGGGVYVAVNEDMATVVDINTFTNVRSRTSRLYSMEYDDGRLFKERAEYGFFGVEGLLTWRN